MSDYPNILLLFLFFNMVLWLITEIYQSILFKLVDHWLYHEGESKDDNLYQCSSGYLECSLFKPRDDISYNLQMLREEIKYRETKMMSMRKPKNKGMLIQTLKCMVAIKRKLSEKRHSDSSDSDDSEKSEDSELRTSENTDDDTGELHSGQDEETDDEESESLESVIETKKVDKDSEEEDKSETRDENKCDDTKEIEGEAADVSKSDNSDDDENFKTGIKSIQEPNVAANKDVKINNELDCVGEKKAEGSINENDTFLLLEGDGKTPHTIGKETDLKIKDVAVAETDPSIKKKIKETGDIGSTE